MILPQKTKFSPLFSLGAILDWATIPGLVGLLLFTIGLWTQLQWFRIIGAILAAPTLWCLFVAAFILAPTLIIRSLRRRSHH